MTRLDHVPSHCPGCGRECEVVRTVTPNHIFELSCGYCEYICVILAQDYIELPTMRVSEPGPEEGQK